MGRYWDIWNAAEGDKITGIIFYFENRDGSYTAVVRTAQQFWVLPAAVAEIFASGRPVEGSEVELEKTALGFQLKKVSHATPTVE